ncbi:MAG: hypothetical protein V4682_03870 [Patescibacteria group bacterium]
MSDKGQNRDSHAMKAYKNNADLTNFVLDKAIFSGVFEKDIRRVYLYKKAERLAKAIHLISPAFLESPALKDRMERIALGLVDASVLPPVASREALSRELLALSSILSIARTGGMLSSMNAELIVREAHLLLSEIVGYEEPRLVLDEIPSLASLAKASAVSESRERNGLRSVARVTYDPALDVHDIVEDKGQSKGQVKDISRSAASMGEKGSNNMERRESILAVLRSKGPSYIKDISMIVRDVSEKTIQRELSALVAEGLVNRKGDRRWTTYEVA